MNEKMVTVPAEWLKKVLATLKAYRELADQMGNRAHILIEELPGLTLDERWSQMRIEELGLTLRTYNRLKKADINTVSELMLYNVEDLMNLRDFGRRCLADLQVQLWEKCGLEFPLL